MCENPEFSIFFIALKKQSSLRMMILSPKKASPKSTLQNIIKCKETWNKLNLRYYMNRGHTPRT